MAAVKPGQTMGLTGVKRLQTFELFSKVGSLFNRLRADIYNPNRQP
jgi:hypothetical protein